MPVEITAPVTTNALQPFPCNHSADPADWLFHFHLVKKFS